MKIGQQINFIVINKTASSLYSLIADGQYRNTSLGRNTWKTLIGSQASLQLDCNKEGFNAVSTNAGASRARIGIIGNNDNDCASCDSRIGFGTGGYPNNPNSCGNEATFSSDNGNKHIKGMGYILVEWEGTDVVRGIAVIVSSIYLVYKNMEKASVQIFLFFFIARWN